MEHEVAGPGQLEWKQQLLRPPPSLSLIPAQIKNIRYYLVNSILLFQRASINAYIIHVVLLQIPRYAEKIMKQSGISMYLAYYEVGYKFREFTLRVSVFALFFNNCPFY